MHPALNSIEDELLCWIESEDTVVALSVECLHEVHHILNGYLVHGLNIVVECVNAVSLVSEDCTEPSSVLFF